MLLNLLMLNVVEFRVVNKILFNRVVSVVNVITFTCILFIEFSKTISITMFN